MRDLRKDLDLADALFGRSAAATPLTSYARTLVTAAAANSGDLDITAVIRRYRPSDRPVPMADTRPAREPAATRAGGDRVPVRSSNENLTGDVRQLE